MIHYTLCDPDFEEYSLSEDGMMALPLTIREDSDGAVTAESYSLTASAIKDVCDGFEESLFTREAHDAVMKVLNSEMEKHGYCSVPETGDVLLEFIHDASTIATAPDSAIPYVILNTNEEISAYRTHTSSWCLEVDDDDPADAVCAVIAGGSIVAFACINDVSEYGYEATVECAPSHRGRGYGSACAYGIARHVLEMCPDETVSYVCRERNVASHKTALRAGYVMSGRRRDYVFYRD
ncbi:MAG: GNAT family N-acetyltransferase [Clostridia bacterium]|nr:GNAT family N-acetyltransferase [Clostridia bacterium]